MLLRDGKDRRETLARVAEFRRMTREEVEALDAGQEVFYVAGVGRVQLARESYRTTGFLLKVVC